MEAAGNEARAVQLDPGARTQLHHSFAFSRMRYAEAKEAVAANVE